MKNNNNIIFLAMAFLTLVFTGCQEDDLIKESPDELNSSNYWESETNANLALTTAYQRLNGGTWSHTEVNYVVENFRSDMTKSGADVIANYPDQNAFSTYSVVDNNTRMLTYWNKSYEGIAAANNVIHNVGLMTEDQISSDAKSRIVAEAKFLRGYFHFRLLMNWEQIVVFDFLPQSADELSQPLSTREEAWTAIENDFSEAAADLATNHSDADRGRATKGAALAFLGKSHLNQLDWANATTTLKEVLDLNNYELASDFSSLFDGSNEATNVLNKETIFDVAYTFNEVNGGNVIFAGIPNFAAAEMDGWEAMLPTQKLLSEMKSEGRISSEIGSVSSLNKYDDRSYGTMFFNDPDVDIYGLPYEHEDWFGPGNTKPGWKKYLHRDELYPNSWRSDINIPLIRYADVLLMYAEALNESGSGDPISHINEVRARAFLPATTASSQQEIREQIMHERAVEFALEGQRFYDLRRWGKTIMTDAISNSGKTGASNFVFEDDAFLPIPSNEKLNNPHIN